MLKPYCNDLPARVIEAIEAGASRREAAEYVAKDLRSRLKAAATTPAPSSPEDFGRHPRAGVRAGVARWEKAIRDKGIKGE